MFIRRAQIEDASQLIPLLKQMGYNLDVVQMAARISAYLVDNNYLLVAEEEGNILGVIGFSLFEMFRLPGKCCYIDALVIDETLRGKGVGKKLLAYAEQLAQEQGSIAVELVSANHRKKGGTHAFYENLGYKTSVTLDCTYFEKKF